MSEEIRGEELSYKLMSAVEEQIASSDTPYVKEQYERLLHEGETEVEAKRLIALCLADEVEEMQKESREFNVVRYKQLLEFLPVLPE